MYDTGQDQGLSEKRRIKTRGQKALLWGARALSLMGFGSSLTLAAEPGLSRRQVAAEALHGMLAACHVSAYVMWGEAVDVF